tara:strand:- start:153 stop:932 length:780 start_codon:yes stop_codon:yes gene_type:complete
MGVPDKTDYENISYQKYVGAKSKILVICTEEKNLKMKNGKLFSTGNHPVESLVPMLHLRNAGFEFEIATPTGKPAIFEMWAFPKKDEHVKAIYNEHKASFEKPLSLSDFISGSFDQSEGYAAVFIPGGHGAMIGIPEDKNVDTILRWAHENELFTISLCHGPGAFLSTTLGNKEFLYKGYNLAVFPDSVDNQTPMIGYLPGKMPYGLSEQLKSLGANLMNTKMDKTVCVDRKLITGSSPLASNELGKLAATELLNGFDR